MTHIPEIRSEADADILEAALWYEERLDGLGLQFLGELDQVIERVAETPRLFPEIAPGVRRALLHRFPYSVYFEYSPEGSAVIAVLHQHRHPATWQDRQ